MIVLNLIARFVRLFTGVQARWLGCGPEPVQRIYFANHTSHFDCVVLLSVLPRNIRARTRPAAAADYWQRGPIRQWLASRVFDVIPIDRTKVSRSNNPIDKLARAIDQGSSLIIFPEGGRSLDSNIADFKSGIYYLCKARPKIDLVPVYIDNANRVLPKGEFLPIPLLCSVTFGRPIHLASGEKKNEFLERARQAVQECAA